MVERKPSDVGLRVSLSGPFNSGKSTLVKPIALLLEVTPLEEVARRFLDDGQDLSSGSVQAGISLVQAERESAHDRFVTDRSLVDALAYARLGLRGSPRGSLGRETFSACVNWCERNIDHRYTHVVLVETAIPLPPHLMGRELFHEQVRREIRQVVAEFSLPNLVVSGSLEENVQRISQWLRQPHVVR